LRVFQLADELVLDVYRETQKLPMEERFGLQSQFRRAAVSVAANIVEGCPRSTTNDYVHFVTIALGSANEARYLIELSIRLNYLKKAETEALVTRYTELIASLANLIRALRQNNRTELSFPVASLPSLSL
jgi:four helix bundle protein